MNYKKAIIKMILSMKNDDYLFKSYHYILVKYRREKEGASMSKQNEYIEAEKEKIIELIKRIDNYWILSQLYRFIINITK